MRTKKYSILFSDVDRETRHYVLRRMINPDRVYKQPTPSNKSLEEKRVKAEEKKLRKMKKNNSK